MSSCRRADVVVAVGLGVVALVIVQNSYAAATVRVQADQQVVSTGLYGLVRHPMYTGNVVMMVGIPLALGSYWGLVFVVPGLVVLDPVEVSGGDAREGGVGDQPQSGPGHAETLGPPLDLLGRLLGAHQQAPGPGEPLTGRT